MTRGRAIAAGSPVVFMGDAGFKTGQDTVIRRSFNSRERVALFLNANGRCRICGSELPSDWHGDHVESWSQTQTTDVLNGQALCEQCNLKKGTKQMDPRTVWQRDAVDSFLASDHDFLVNACPAAGKTRMALLAARELVEGDAIDRVIVVAPTRNIVQQWSREASSYSLDITATFENRHGTLYAEHGVATTYHMVASEPLIWKKLTGQRRSLVIFDEIHHCSDDDNSTWGPAIAEAFGRASRRLLLSGTPFRTDGTPIPFVGYDDLGMAIEHHGLSYRSAVEKGIVRPMRFEVRSGDGEWLRGAERRAASTGNHTQQDRAGLLSTLFDPEGRWIRAMFQAANEELSRIREEMPDAAGLVVAQNIWKAEQYKKLMAQVCGEDALVVHSDYADAVDRIGEFRDGTSPWIIAVDMISEGVDIPRLAVGVYATDINTEMWFRQFCGRLVRSRGPEDAVVATMMIPAMPKLVEMAERIEEEANVALREAEKAARDDLDGSGQGSLFDIIPIASSEALLDSIVVHGDTVASEELEKAREYQEKYPTLKRANLEELAMLLREAGRNQGPTPIQEAPSSAVSGDQLRQALRKQLKAKVGTLVNRTSCPWDYPKVNGILKSEFGGPPDSASITNLEKRIQQVDEWIEQPWP